MKRVLVAGGYGVVGEWIVRNLRAAGHDLELVIGGRNPESATGLAVAMDARTARIDCADAAGCLAALGPVDLVVSVLQDPNDDLLKAALRSGAAHLGIVRKVDNVGPTAIAAAALARRPALLAGHWQAGVATYAALAAVQRLSCVESIEIGALFDPADAAGPMAREDSGAFFAAALARRSGHWVQAEKSGIRMVGRGELPAFAAQPMGVLDVAGLAAVTDAPEVRFDIGLGESVGTSAGRRPSHDIYIDVQGVDESGDRRSVRTVVSDPQGQAHLTALGVLIGTERILGLDGANPPAAGLVLPERAVDPLHAVSRLRAFGVQVSTGMP
jgi:hypothetical protein